MISAPRVAVEVRQQARTLQVTVSQLWNSMQMQTLVILVGLVLAYPFQVNAQVPKTPAEYLELLHEIEDVSQLPKYDMGNSGAIFEQEKKSAPRLEILYRRKLAYQAKHESLGPEIAHTFDVLARSLKTQEKLKDADAMFLQAIQVLQKVDDAKYRASPWHRIQPLNKWMAKILQQRAEIAILQKRVADSDKYFAEAEKALVSEFGYWHKEIADNNHLQGMLLREAGYLEKSLGNSRRAIAIYEKLYGGSNPRYAYQLANLADLLLEMDRETEADQLYARERWPRKLVLVDK
jgi:tetratricopeptide (TPR) repeat protein